MTAPSEDYWTRELQDEAAKCAALVKVGAVHEAEFRFAAACERMAHNLARQRAYSDGVMADVRALSALPPDDGGDIRYVPLVDVNRLQAMVHKHIPDDAS